MYGWLWGSMQGLTAGVLAVATVQDIREKKISVWIPAGAILPGILYCALTGIRQGLLGFLIWAAGWMLLSLVTGNRFGLGDSLLLIALYPLCGGYGTVMILSTAALLAAVYLLIKSIVSAFLSKGKNTAELPFIPFLAAGFVLRVILKLLV